MKKELVIIVKRSHGPRQGTRKKLSRKKRDKGLSPITRLFQNFQNGEKVNIVIDPSIHKGQPYHRFHGHTGEVIGKQGRAFVIKINDGNKEKQILITSEHLRSFSPEKKPPKVWNKRTKIIHPLPVRVKKESKNQPKKIIEPENKENKEIAVAGETEETIELFELIEEDEKGEVLEIIED
jgi:large subunit ribosomal protein L21e